MYQRQSDMGLVTWNPDDKATAKEAISNAANDANLSERALANIPEQAMENAPVTANDIPDEGLGIVTAADARAIVNEYISLKSQ